MKPVTITFNVFTNNHKIYGTQTNALGTGVFTANEAGFGTIKFFDNFVDGCNVLVHGLQTVYMDNFDDTNELSGYIRQVYLVPIVTKRKKRVHLMGVHIPLHIVGDVVKIFNITGKIETTDSIVGKYGDKKFLKKLQTVIAKNIAKDARTSKKKATSIYKLKNTEWELIYPERYQEILTNSIMQEKD